MTMDRGARRRGIAVVALVAICACMAWWSGVRRREGGSSAREPQHATAGRVALATTGSSVWVPVPGAAAPDLMALSFSPHGDIGAAVSSEGILLVTRDGGLNWQTAGQAPLGDGEMATVVVARPGGRIFVGAGVDESKFTAFYDWDGAGNWRVRSGDYGGVIGSSDDGSLLVGGGGLVARAQGDDWTLSELPPCGQVMLYGAAREGQTLLVAGDFGLLARSRDGGRTWDCSTLKVGETGAPLYAVALAGDNAMAGGARGTLWRLRSAAERWEQVEGLGTGMSVFAAHLDDGGAFGFAAGGNETGGAPFILASSDGGVNWRTEAVREARGRVISLARGRAGLFAATLDGRILVRRESSNNSTP